jgi:quercetin dioxygenase-like cupin family protein
MWRRAVPAVNEADFQRAAERDDIKVARTEMTPGRTTSDHDHAWDTRGLVLERVFTIEMAGNANAYHPGEVFEVPAGVVHSERHDPNGGLLLIGRRKTDEP